MYLYLPGREAVRRGVWLGVLVMFQVCGVHWYWYGYVVGGESTVGKPWNSQVTTMVKSQRARVATLVKSRQTSNSSTIGSLHSTFYPNPIPHHVHLRRRV